MNGLTGMEKFSHLEDKIYLTIEFAKRIREEKEKIEQECRDNVLALPGVTEVQLESTAAVASRRLSSRSPRSTI